MNLFPPTVTAKTTSVQIGDSVAFNNMFEASDLDGNPILTVSFRDNNGAATSGFFTVAGVRQDPFVFIEVDFADLGSVRYHAGLIESTESFSVRVSDGQVSMPDAASVFTVPQNFFPPTVTPIPGSVLETEQLDPRSLFSVSDPEGNPIVRYFVVDRKTNDSGGHFLLNGVRQESGVFFIVEADQLDDLVYVGGRFAQTENIGIQAFDGEFYSAVVNTSVTTTANMFRPVVNAFNVNTGPNRSLAAASLFSYSDLDGNTPKTFGFLDTGLAEGSGYFTINGVVQEAGSYFTIDADQLSTVRYNTSSSSDSEIFRVFAGDGRFSSEVASGTVNVIPRPKLDVDDFTVIVDTLERVDFADLLTQSDNGPPLETFQVIDQNAFPLSARLLLNGQRLEQGVVHTLTANQFANLQIEGGTAEGRFADQFLVRGKNSLFYTDWEEFRINTDPVGPDALVSGTSWGDQYFDGQKHVITYTFIDGTNDGDDPPSPPLPTYYSEDDDEADMTTAMDFAMRNDVREALAIIETYADIDFVEVPFTLDAAEAVMTFGLHMDDGPFNVLAHAFLPIGDGRGTKPGDVWYDIADYPFQGTQVGAGSEFRATTLHEVGHTLGFKHPFTPDPVLPIFVDFAEYSIMSYTRFNLHPEEPSTLMLWDVQELQRLYGANEDFNTGNDHYRFNTPNLQLLWDGGGKDTINYTNHVIGETIDLHEGAFSTIQGVPNSLMIGYGAIIENARGGSGADTILGNSYRNLLFGNENNDVLEGDGGNDVLRGGANDDTYIWRLGDGRDRIQEEMQGGSDAIHIFDDTALDSLENDLVFRRFGDELRVDLRFDRQAAQGSIRIIDQESEESKIETLRLFTASGDQIGEDIDLDSIYQQATTSAQFFTLTNQQTENGFIAIPFV